jgi:hypothetical protein
LFPVETCLAAAEFAERAGADTLRRPAAQALSDVGCAVGGHSSTR